MRNVLVFFGGKSCEHDVSIITGVLTTNSIDKSEFNAIPIYVSKDGVWHTGDCLKDIEWFKSKNLSKLTTVTLIAGSQELYQISKNKLKKVCTVTAVINCMHGLNGEDGSLAGYLKLCNIPFASPDLYGSSLAIDKDYTKLFLSGINVEKLPYVRLFKELYYSKKQSAVNIIEKRFGYPVIVKPSNLGSSIGITLAKSSGELLTALDKAFTYDEKVIVEKAITNFTEINCSAYKCGDKVIVSECEEPVSANEILSFSDKYLGAKGGASRNFPANIPPNISQKIKAITEKVYRKADFIGVIRIDYLVKDDKIYLNEINTVPGSLAYYLHSDSIKGFSEMLTALLKEGINKHLKTQRLNFNYNSSVIDNIKGVKGAKTR